MFDASPSSQNAPLRETAAASRVHPPETVTLRAGTRADVSALEALERRAFTHDRISHRSFSRFLSSPSGSLVVADCAGGLCGYAVVLFRAQSRLARLYSIAVDSAHAGRQIGSSLLNAAEVAARTRGFTGVRLEVSERNSAARNLYHRGGYVVVGRLHAYYADGDALRLQKLFV